MNRIYWFSGTGNTLKLARDFASALGDTELVPIASQALQHELPPDCESVGIFLPVYCFGIPRIVSRFLKTFKFASGGKPPYIYAACTSGGMPCATLPMVGEILERNGLKLSAGFSFVMPGNYIPLSGPPTDARQEKLFEKAGKKLLKAVEVVKERRVAKIEASFLPLSLIGRFVARKAIACLPAADRWFWTDTKCDGCGLCVKICPVSDITLESGKPKWNRNCEQCMACLQWCPRESIQFRSSSLRRRRYRNPEVTPDQLILKKSS